MNRNNINRKANKTISRRKQRSLFTPSTVRHSGARRIRRRRRIDARRFIPTCIFAILAIIGLIKLSTYLLCSWKNQISIQQLEAVYSGDIDVEKDEPYDRTKDDGTAVIDSKALQELIDNEAKLGIYNEPYIQNTRAPLDDGVFHTIGCEMIADMQKLYRKNADLIGWIRIPGVVSLPVVYRDNEYYLNHDYYGKRNSAGTLFLDESHPFTATTQYLVIHGHDMFDGSMFGLLTHYRRSSYMSEHPNVYFTSLYERETYRVFGVLVLPINEKNENYMAYTGMPTFTDRGQFDSFISELKDRALYWDKYGEPDYTDALLSLSTCMDDERVVVICKKD